MKLLDDRIKYFFYGLIVGGKQIERVKEPVDIPVEIINIGYDNSTMFIGERQILTASIFPLNASYKEVEWYSSDISVISINKVTPTTAEVYAVNTGDVIITCKATDGSGVTATLNMYAVSNKVYTEFAFGNLSTGLGNFRTPDSLAEVIYKPVDMEADRWGLILDPTLTGAESPYDIINTPFKNIKCIKNKFNSVNYNDYFTNESFNIGYDINTYDGSGFKLEDLTITNIGSELRDSLYGADSNTNTESEIELKIGYTVNLYSALNRSSRPEQCLYLNSLNMIIDNQDIISIDKYKNVKGLSVGKCTVKIELPTGNYWQVVINVVDTPTKVSRPSVYIIDDNGLEIINNEGRVDTGIGNIVYLAVSSSLTASGGIVKVTEVTNPDIAEVTEDGGVLVKSTGSVTIRYNLVYNGSDGESTYESTLSIRVIGSSIVVGTILSDYIDEGIVVYAESRGVLYSNGYLTNKINIIYNANQVELKQILMCSKVGVKNFDTLTFNPALTSTNGTVNLYHIVKNTTSTVRITFQLEGDPSVFTEIDI